MRLPIRLRLTGWYVLLLTAVLAGVGVFVVTRLRADLGEEIDRSLASAAPTIAQGYAAEGPKDFRDVASTVFPALPAGPAAAQVLDAQGRVIVAYGAARARRPVIGGNLLRAGLHGRRLRVTVSVGGEPFRMFALPVRRNGRGEVLVLAKSMRNRDDSVRRLVVLLLIAFPAALLAASAGGWLLARRALRPVDRMTSQADRIGVDRLAERIAVPTTRDEIAHLATTLNAMLGRLQRGLDEKRRLVADTSHELRTPLTAMRAELDVSLDYDGLPPRAREVLASTREEVERMTTLVANLLTLASIDEGRLQLRKEPVDLTHVLRQVAHRLEPMASAASIEVEVDAPPAAAVGDEERIRDVATNLLTNAIKFAGASARVRLATWRSGSESGFTVEDTGPGIALSAQERIFERFARADDSRARSAGGTGLGLAICREIVAAHGGRIAVESQPGRGTCFSVALPAAAVPEPASLR
jgi:heavy metal sensor kinase